MHLVSAARQPRRTTHRATLALGTLAILHTLALAAPATRDEPPLAIVQAMTIAQNEQAVTVRLDLSHPRQPQMVTMNSPAYKVYFDIPSARIRPEAVQSKERNVGHRFLTGVRLGQFSDQPPIARIVFDVTGRERVSATETNGGKTWLFTIAGGAGTPKEPAARKPVTRLESLSVTANEAEKATIELEVGEGVAPNAYALTNPNRLVLDLDRTELRARLPRDWGQGLIRDLTLDQFTGDTVRLIATLAQDALVEVRHQPGRSPLTVTLTAGRAAAALRMPNVGGGLVVIDPGHGGRDPGAVGGAPGLNEKTVNLDMGLRVKRLLEARGVQVLMTREGDTFVELRERADIANRAGADLFVSIHCNAMPTAMKGQRSGTEMYSYTPRSSEFSQVMVDAVSAAAKTPNRGTFRRAFVVVRYTNMPSVLVEVGYIDNANDAALIGSEEGRQRFAEGMAAGILSYLSSITGRVDTGATPVQLAGTEGPR